MQQNKYFYHHIHINLTQVFAFRTLFLHKTITREDYRKVPKFSDGRKFCCNLPKIQTKKPNFRVFSQKDANTIANSVDPDQTDPRGAV